MYFVLPQYSNGPFVLDIGLWPEEFAHATFFVFVTIEFWTRFSHMGQGGATGKISFVLLIFCSACKQVAY